MRLCPVVTCSDCNGGQVTAGVFTFNGSTERVIAYQEAASTIAMGPSTVAAFTLGTPLSVASGDYIGLWAKRSGDGAGVVPYTNQGASRILYSNETISSSVVTSNQTTGNYPRFEFTINKA